MNPAPPPLRKPGFRLGRLYVGARAAMGSLRLKVGLAVMGASAAVFVLLALFFWHTVERETRATVAEQQRTIARNVAADVARQVALSRDGLTELARRLYPVQFGDAAAIEWLLRADGALLQMLDDVVVHDAGGIVIADWPVFPGRRGKDRSGTEYFRAAMASGAPHLSKPFLGPAIKSPVVVLSVAVPDAAGRPAGVISGLMRLAKPGFMLDLASRRIGTTGYFMLADAEGTILLDRRPERVLTKALDDAAGAAIRALQRDERALHESPRGSIYAVAPVTGTGWNLLAVLPKEEAYRSLGSMRWTLASIFLLLIAAAGLVIWHLVGRLLAPLVALRTATQAFFPDSGGSTKLDLSHVPRGTAEIDGLADAFRRAVERTESARADLGAERAFLNAVLENAGALVLVLDRDGRIRRFNRACEELSGYAFAEVEGTFPWDRLLPPDEADTVRREAFEALARDPRTLKGRHSNHWLTKARERRFIEWSNTLLLDARGSMAFMVSVGVDVTQRLQAEAAQRDTDRRMRAFMDNVPALIAHFDMEQRFLYANKAYGEFFSVDPQGIVGRPLVAAIGEDSARLAQPHMERLAAGEPVNYEGRRVRPGGHVGHVCCVGVPEFGEDGRQRGYFVLTADDTAHKLAEGALRASESHLRAILDTEPECVKLLDREGRLLEMNPAGLAMIEADSVEQVRGERVGSIVNEADRAAFAEMLAAVFRGESRMLEFGIRGLRGTRRHLEMHSVPMWDEHRERVAALLGVTRDITARRAAQDALRRSENQIRLLIDSLPLAVGYCDTAERITYANRPYRETYPALPDPVGRTIREVIGEETYAIVQSSIARVLTGEPVRYERAYVRADGTTGVRDVRFVPDREAGGKLAGTFVLVEDITTRKQAENAIRTALAEKEVLLKEIYHRVKNNLQVVAGLLHMQGRGVADPGMRKLFAESANRVKSMALVHEQLYRAHDLSNIALADYLTQLAAHLEYAHRPLSARVPLRLEVTELRLGIESAVPLGLIVNELVSNAYKHGFTADTVRGEIVLHATSLDDGRVRVAVTDDGLGLPPGFEPKRVTSLGMQLVLTLVAQLGGQLQQRSAGGRTSFEVLFRPDAGEADRQVA